MIAGKAAGVYDDLAEVASQHARASGPPFPPQEDHQATYQAMVEHYINLQSTLHDTFIELGKRDPIEKEA
jgi:hypothetical protein